MHTSKIQSKTNSLVSHEVSTFNKYRHTKVRVP